MKKIYYLILSFVAVMSFSGCSNDDDVAVDAINSSLFAEAEDFTDPRDGHTYKCIKVGNQIWMAENLAYYMEEGSTGGCFTWDEEPLDLEKVQVGLTYEQWKAAFIDWGDSTYPGAAWAWGMPFGGPFGIIAMMEGNFGANTAEGILEGMETLFTLSVNCPDFVERWEAALAVILEEEKERRKPEIIKKHLANAEKENGNYSKEYGYLYSLDAARKAVPDVDGWRLPSDEDWKKLERALGMSESEVERNNAWRGINAGDYLKEGGISMFEAKLAGCNAYVGGTNGQNYINLKEGGYFWTNEETVTETNGETLPTDENNKEEEEGSGTGDSDEEEENGLIREGVCRFVSIYSSQIWRGVTRLDNGYRETTYSVRCVKDIN